MPSKRDITCCSYWVVQTEFGPLSPSLGITAKVQAGSHGTVSEGREVGRLEPGQEGLSQQDSPPCTRSLHL